MFQKDYKRDLSGLSPSPAALERLDGLLKGGRRQRLMLRHPGRRAVAAAVLCALLALTAAAAGPTVWDALTAHLGPFTAYLTGGGANSVSSGVELTVAGAISDGASAKVYLIARDREGRLDGRASAALDLEGANSWGARALAYDEESGTLLLELEADGLTDGGTLALTGGTLTPGQYWATRHLDPAGVSHEPLECTVTDYGRAVLLPGQAGQTFDGLDGLTLICGFDSTGTFHLRAVLEKGYSMTAPVQVFAVSSDGSACIPEPEDRAHLADGQDVVLPGVSRENWDQVTDLWVSLSYKGPEEPIEGDWTLTLTARETAGVSTPADFSLDVSAGTTVTGVSLSPLGVVVEYTGQPGDLPPDAVEVALAGGSSPEWGETSAWNWGGEGYLIRRFAAPAEIEGASAALFGQTVPLA